MSLKFDHELQTLLDLTAFGTAHAGKLGLDRVKFVCTASKLIRLVSENGDFTLANSLDSKKIGVLVHHNQRKGAASTNATSENDMIHALQQARDLAGFSVADEFLTMPSSDEASPVAADPRLCDDAVTELSIQDLKAAAEPVIDDLLSDERLALERLEISASIGIHHLANSLGVRQVELQTSVDWDVMGMATDADEVSGFDYDGGFTFSRAGFESKLQQDAARFKERVLQNLHPRPSPSYKGQIILTPRAVEDLILDTILYHASGYQIMDGKSRWEKHLGERIASTALTITDHPDDIDLEGATTYDSDGLPTRALTLVEQGILKAHLWDCYSAKRMACHSNAMGGGPFGLHIQSGSDALADFYKARKEIVVLDRFSGNVDPLTGDFSGVAKTSSLYVNGQRACAIGETMIAGNAFDLMTQITGVSREWENVSGDHKSPYLLVDGVSVSAK